MTNAVEVRHLSKSIEGSPILNDICMNVRQGEVYGFLGANGAGKTSLMKTLYHIIFPDKLVSILPYHRKANGYRIFLSPVPICGPAHTRTVPE